MTIEIEGTGICEDCGYPTWMELIYDEAVILGRYPRLLWEDEEFLPYITVYCDNCGSNHDIDIDLDYAIQLIGQRHQED